MSGSQMQAFILQCGHYSVWCKLKVTPDLHSETAWFDTTMYEELCMLLRPAVSECALLQNQVKNKSAKSVNDFICTKKVLDGSNFEISYQFKLARHLPPDVLYPVNDCNAWSKASAADVSDGDFKNFGGLFRKQVLLKFLVVGSVKKINPTVDQTCTNQYFDETHVNEQSKELLVLRRISKGIQSKKKIKKRRCSLKELECDSQDEQEWTIALQAPSDDMPKGQDKQEPAHLPLWESNSVKNSIDRDHFSRSPVESEDVKKLNCSDNVLEQESEGHDISVLSKLRGFKETDKIQEGNGKDEGRHLRRKGTFGNALKLVGDDKDLDGQEVTAEIQKPPKAKRTCTKSSSLDNFSKIARNRKASAYNEKFLKPLFKKQNDYLGKNAGRQAQLSVDNLQNSCSVDPFPIVDTNKTADLIREDTETFKRKHTAQLSPKQRPCCNISKASNKENGQNTQGQRKSGDYESQFQKFLLMQMNENQVNDTIQEVQTMKEDFSDSKDSSKSQPLLVVNKSESPRLIADKLESSAGSSKTVKKDGDRLDKVTEEPNSTASHSNSNRFALLQKLRSANLDDSCDDFACKKYVKASSFGDNSKKSKKMRCFKWRIPKHLLNKEPVSIQTSIENYLAKESTSEQNSQDENQKRKASGQCRNQSNAADEDLSIVSEKSMTDQELQAQIAEIRDVRLLQPCHFKYLLKKYFPDLLAISRGEKYSNKHAIYYGKSNRKRISLTYDMNLGKFLDWQLDNVIDLILNKFGKYDCNVVDYLQKVIIPEFLICIHMEVTGLDHDESDELLRKEMDKDDL